MTETALVPEVIPNEQEPLPALEGIVYTEDDYKTDIEEDDSTCPNNKRRIPINMNRILKLIEKGKTEAEVAKIIGCREVTIKRKIKSYLALKDKVQDFSSRRAETFANIQRMCADSIDFDEIKALKVPQRMWVMAVAYDKERLESNKSTNNIAVNIRGLSDKDKNMLAKMAAEYAQTVRDTVKEETYD